MFENSEDHFLLILSDSALPIGSFAYSSGLESFHQHHKSVPDQLADADALRLFLEHSIQSIGSTTVPFLRAAYQEPHRAADWDDLFDANTPCLVARRSSIAQGRALVKLVDRMMSDQESGTLESDDRNAIKLYRKSIQTRSCAGHFGVAFGLAGRVLDISLDRLAYAFLHAHLKAVLSAAVRLSWIGPYESTEILASKAIRDFLSNVLEESRDMTLDDCGQTFAMLDIYQGRHELLYSRIFSA